MSRSPASFENFAPPAVIGAWQRRALLVALPFTVLAVIGWVLAFVRPDYDQFYRSYLVGYMLCFGLALGSLGVLMVYHATGGDWGTAIRRILEAGSSTLWLLAIGFIPIVIGAHRLYPWTHADVVAADEHLRQIAPQYLNVKLFVLRAALFYIAWIALSQWLRRQSDRQDREAVVLDTPLRRVSSAGLALYALTLTLASVDWVMSLDPGWSSTIYGLLFLAGQGLIAWSFAMIVLNGLLKYPPLDTIVKSEQVHDNGKMILATVMLWGYFVLSQWLIIWSGNLPDEISWYLNRTRGGWREFTFFLIIGQFFIPFFMLLSRSFKSDARKLARLAAWIIFMRYWDLYFLVMPNFENRKGHFHYSWQDAVVPIALLSWWLYAFLGQLKSRPLLAVHDDHVQLLLEQPHDEMEHERA